MSTPIRNAATRKGSSSQLSSQDRVNLLNVLIDNLSREELLEQLEQGVVFTPNVDHIIKLQNDNEFLETYNTADYKLCDSKVLVYASRFLGTPLKEQIAGSDFFPAFCEYHANNEKVKIFLLGGSDKGVAAEAQTRINTKVEREIIVGSYFPPYGFESKEEECSNIVEAIKSSEATVLAIGVGAPKQEKWIIKYKKELANIKIFFALGATIDFEAGYKKRAPKWMSLGGIEWLYRLLVEPRRLWRRYLVDDIPFFWLVLKQKFDAD